MAEISCFQTNAAPSYSHNLPLTTTKKKLVREAELSELTWKLIGWILDVYIINVLGSFFFFLKCWVAKYYNLKVNPIFNFACCSEFFPTYETTGARMFLWNGNTLIRSSFCVDLVDTWYLTLHSFFDRTRLFL